MRRNSFRMTAVAVLVVMALASQAQEINWQRQVQGTLDGLNMALWHGGAEYTKPVLVDIDNDGDGDLFVGEHDGYLNYFKNLGGDPPNWLFVSSALDSIDVYKQAAPAFWDADLDGDQDLFLGNENGTIWFYRNDGSPQMPLWTYADSAYFDIDVGWHATPTFCDLDADGLTDLLVGRNDSTLYFYRNQGQPGSPDFVLADTSYQGIQYGPAAKLTVFAQDLNWDYLPDLLVSGENGPIYYYRNEGPGQNPAFADSVQCALVNHNGSPAVWDVNGDGLSDLVSGEGVGNLNYWANTGSHTQPRFQLAKDYLAYFDLGYYSMPALVDIDADSDLDLFIGHQPIGLYFLQNVGTPDSPAWHQADTLYMGINLPVPMAPAFCDLDNDGDPDMMLGCADGTLTYYQNIGSPQIPQWAAPVYNYAAVDVGENSAPTFADYNRDGDYDLFIGAQTGPAPVNPGAIRWLKNVGTPISPTWEDLGNIPMGTPVGTYYAPALIDIDGDDHLDFIIGDGTNAGNLIYYRNVGTYQQPSWSLMTPVYRGWDFGDRSAPCFGDLDNDGKLDLLVGCMSGGIYYFKQGGAWYNVSLEMNPINQPTYVPIQGGNVQYYLSIHNYDPATQFVQVWTTLTLPNTQIIAPLDSFSLAIPPQTAWSQLIAQPIAGTLPQGVYTLSAFVGTYPDNFYSSDNFSFEKVTDSLAVPGFDPEKSALDFHLGAPHPNPFNGTTRLDYSLPTSSQVHVVVFDICGRRVLDLTAGRQIAGRHSLSVSLDHQASGIYFVLLQAGNLSSVQKLCYIR